MKNGRGWRKRTIKIFDRCESMVEYKIYVVMYPRLLDAATLLHQTTESTYHFTFCLLSQSPLKETKFGSLAYLLYSFEYEPAQPRINHRWTEEGSREGRGSPDNHHQTGLLFCSLLFLAKIPRTDVTIASFVSRVRTT